MPVVLELSTLDMPRCLAASPLVGRVADEAIAGLAQLVKVRPVAEVVDIELDVRHQPAEQQWNMPRYAHTRQCSCHVRGCRTVMRRKAKSSSGFPGVSAGIAQM